MKFRGSGLVEYAVPLALVGLVVGMGFYYLSGNDNLLGFFLKSTNGQYDTTSKTITLNKKETVAASVFSKNPFVSDPVIHPTGTSAKPTAKSDCNAGICTIEYGSFILTGVPDNLADYVKTNGTSGGTEKLAAIFEQIADALQNNGDAAGASQFRDLANLGHFNAKLQRKLENIAKISTDYDDYRLKTAGLNELIPANISSIVPNFKESTVFGFLDSTQLGLARKRTSDPIVFENDKTSRPGAAMYSIYSDIMANAKYPDSLKLLTQALLREIDTASEDMYQQLYFTGNNPPDSNQFKGVKFINFIDGLIKDPGEYKYNNDLSKIYQLQTSKLTDIDSVLICLSGKNLDTGKDCY